MDRVYSVTGMTCGHCRAAVEEHVGAVPGVSGVAVDVSAGTVRVEGDAAEHRVRAAIVEAGYGVV